jgi:hypothetical protein
MLHLNQYGIKQNHVSACLFLLIVNDAQHETVESYISLGNCMVFFYIWLYSENCRLSWKFAVVATMQDILRVPSFFL